MYEYEFINRLTGEHEIYQSNYLKAPELGVEWQLVRTDYVEEY